MSSYRHNYEAIFFDFDGVLADTEPLHWRCWRTLLEPYGIGLEWSDYRQSCVGVANATMLGQLAARAPSPVDVRELLGLNRRKRQMFQDLLATTQVIDKSIVPWLLGLSEYRMAVVSSSSSDEVRPALRRAGIYNCFEMILCGEDVTNQKPAPDPYIRVGELLGARQALVVEDTVIGVRSGRAAGFDVLLISTPRTLPVAVDNCLRGSAQPAVPGCARLFRVTGRPGSPCS